MFFIFRFDLDVKHHPYFSNKSHGPEKRKIFLEKKFPSLCVFMSIQNIRQIIPLKKNHLVIAIQMQSN